MNMIMFTRFKIDDQPETFHDKNSIWICFLFAQTDNNIFIMNRHGNIRFFDILLIFVNLVWKLKKNYYEQGHIINSFNR